MTRISVPLPEVMAIAATRGMLGAGIGLLVADKFRKKERTALGWTLLAIGALTTIPLMLDVLGRRETSEDAISFEE